MIIKFFLLIGLLPYNHKSQNQEPFDLVDTFYSWYIKEGYLYMKPSYIELEDGMTDMNFTKYDSLYREYGFSEQLIEKSKLIYRNCRINLSKVLYKEFSEYQDLDQFENISCDFQSFQWFNSGMEPFKYYNISEVKEISNLSRKIIIEFWYHKNDKVKRYRTFIVEKSDLQWKITDFE